jgi:hypothetical protein
MTLHAHAGSLSQQTGVPLAELHVEGQGFFGRKMRHAGAAVVIGG